MIPFAAALILTPVGAQAQAHPLRLVASYPAGDSLHEAAISQIHLRFSGPVQPKLSAITVLGPEGAEPETAPVAVVPAASGREVAVHFSHPLPSGSYTVEWRTAGADGRVVRGSFGFSVKLPAPPPSVTGSGSATAATGSASTAHTQASRSASEAPGAHEPGPGGLGVQWLFLLSIIGMIGTVAFRMGVVAPLTRRKELAEVSERIGRRLVRLAWVFAIVGAVALPLRLGYQATLLSGPGETLFAAAGTLLGSLWGSAWLLELASVALFLVAILLLGPAPRLGPWFLALMAAVLAALVPGLSGHATRGGVDLVTANTVHVLAAGTWAGGLACLVLVGIPAANAADPETSALSAVVSAFSRVALPAVGVLVLSGLWNAASHVALHQLLTTSYGRVLVIKLVVVLGAFSLGFYNWRMVRPALEGRARTGLLSVPATLELVAALTVLAVTAALALTGLP